ncbi:MAG: hypothetical protein H6810_09760 [Phycisphaeraceae bacterium]|nr:MAG: hypothetical protein H6810_09760 [Phycisphaeraceae bacterium]
MRSLTLVLLGVSAVAANGEPVVVRWLASPSTVSVSDSTTVIPPLTFAQFPVTAAGTYSVYPFFGADGWNSSACDPTPFECQRHGPSGYAGTPIGATISSAMPGWVDAFFCFEFEITWPVILVGGEAGCGGPGCPEREIFLAGLADGVSSFPIRIRDDAGEWHYGWVALRGEERFLPDCNYCADNPPIAMEHSDFGYFAIGFETQAGTPIVNGGGLCEADMDFDAVLDLDDLSVFVQAFVGGDLVADLNGNGLLDLADVQRFITSYVSGCNL